jgi:branched-chain amino acid transport system ATP-binding protein
MSVILELENISKAFGQIVVAEEMSFELKEGEALGVIGPNGAGKTSMFNLITGTLKPDSGRIIYNHKDITPQDAAIRCRSGISRSFQVPQPFGVLSVFENVLVAVTQGAGLKSKEANELSLHILEQTGLHKKANVMAGQLTLLDRKRLELARALGVQPKVMLLDEIAGGLTEHECTSLIKTINNVKETGVSIIWIEHVVHALLAVVDRLIVIDFGKKIADGEPKPVMASNEVKEIYLGIDSDV